MQLEQHVLKPRPCVCLWHACALVAVNARNVLVASSSTAPYGAVAKLADLGLSRVIRQQATHKTTNTVGTLRCAAAADTCSSSSWLCWHPCSFPSCLSFRTFGAQCVFRVCWWLLQCVSSTGGICNHTNSPCLTDRPVLPVVVNRVCDCLR